MNFARRTVRSLGLAGLVGLGFALAACDGGQPFGQPVGQFSTTSPSAAHVVTAARGDRHSADFEMASGVTTLAIHSGDIGDALYRIATPAGGGLVPAAVVSGDHVVTQLVSSGTSGSSIVDVTLSSAVAWTIHLDGGATEATVDMHNGGLAGATQRIDVDNTAGVSSFALDRY